MKRILTLIVCTVALNASGQVPDYVPTDGLIGWWPLDGAAGDLSANSLHGDLVGTTPATSRHGLIGHAIEFDGLDDFLRVAHAEVFDSMMSSFTISIWIKNITYNQPDWVYYVSKTSFLGSPPMTNGVVLRAGADGSSEFGYTPNVATSNGEFGITSPQSINTSAYQWEHVILTFDGSSFKLFFNAQEVSSTSTGEAGVVVSTAALTVGAANNGEAHHAAASLDDLGIWNRALNSEEINVLFNWSPIPGCLDNTACNFNLEAQVDDESCLYFDACGECGGAGMAACSDSSACNYNPAASCDDGSCIYPPVIDLGDDIATCEDSVTLDAGPGFDSYLWSTGDTTQAIVVTALNESVEVSVAGSNNQLDNNSLYFDMYDDYLEWEGPVIPSSGHFSFMAWANCPYPVPTGGQGNSPDEGGYGNGYRNIVSQGDTENAIFIGYQPDGKMRVSHSWSNIPVDYPFGRWVHVAVVVDADAQMSSLYLDGVLEAQTTSVEFPSPGTWFRVGRQWGNVHEDWFGHIDDVQIWDIPLTGEDILGYMQCPPAADETGLVGFWNFNEGSGSAAYDFASTPNHGVIVGATWSESSPQQSCNTFCSSEDATTVTFLTPGCTDPNACNFDLEAICDDGNCATCEALQGACGPGTTWDPETSQCVIEEPCGWNPDSDDDSLVGVSDLLMFLSVFGSEWPEFNCGDPVLYQGYEYETVQIGEQCWFAENLRSENYSNGDTIPNNLSQADWSSTTEGAVGVSGESGAECEESYSPILDGCNPLDVLSSYGRHYNWFATNDTRGLCPNGWHVPAIDEWDLLTTNVGEAGFQDAEGYALKSETGWYQSGNGLDFFDFNGEPAGYRDVTLGFRNLGSHGWWWSSSALEEEAMFQGLAFNADVVSNEFFEKRTALSIRCIKDTE